ncbi:MAG: hypothetical protein ABR609_11175, partial [Acidimicrobiia bacterium]
SNIHIATLARWHVEVGTEAAFGQPICDLAASERVRIRSVRRADRLARIARRGKSVTEAIETERDRFVVTYRVLASEPARIVDLRAAPGDEVVAGTLLAVVETTEDGDDGWNEDAAPLMRAVAARAPGSEGE